MHLAGAFRDNHAGLGTEQQAELDRHLGRGIAASRPRTAWMAGFTSSIACSTVFPARATISPGRSACCKSPGRSSSDAWTRIRPPLSSRTSMS
jgi:hypothetical protein